MTTSWSKETEWFGTPLNCRVAVKELRRREAKRAIKRGAVCHLVRLETARRPAYDICMTEVVGLLQEMLVLCPTPSSTPPE
eukprot:Cvel_29534.t1-p1 / transcript=Cvel_29534.t1 / gene=Cvel_29534 / organism=Chromera_velia_CCMP2878 / gene_product=hypothetical protein / transcript_product=hypothetical protein / location=Cvel_scaffold4058:2046-6290(-) / protein_length=80 / sequence_SO=supercontig / SO=protein_coding / is_pseudo=false